MPVVIPSGFAQMTFTHTLANSPQIAEVTFGVNFTDAAAFESVGDAWGTLVLPALADDWTYVEASARVAAGAVFSKTYDIDGGHAGQPLPPNVALLVRKNTGAPGRKHRGRMYIPGIQEADVDPVGNVVGTTVTGFNGIWEDLLLEITNAVAGGFGNMVILHGDATSPSNVESLLTQSLVATQRRRLRG